MSSLSLQLPTYLQRLPPFAWNDMFHLFISDISIHRNHITDRHLDKNHRLVERPAPELVQKAALFQRHCAEKSKRFKVGGKSAFSSGMISQFTKKKIAPERMIKVFAMMITRMMRMIISPKSSDVHVTWLPLNVSSKFSDVIRRSSSLEVPMTKLILIIICVLVRVILVVLVLPF